MKKLETIFLLTLSINFISAQNIDSLYNTFVNSLETTKENLILQGAAQNQKCGLPLIQYLKNNFDKLTIEQQNKISSIASRPETQASVVTPSGNFRIHFDTTGTHRVLFSLNELAVALDSAWNYEVNILGYPPPPSDGTEGGDALYDVYIQELGSTYGWTDASSNSGSPSYIQIDNDFAAQYTTGIDGAKVTVAHELHHAIQIGNYVYKIEDSYYYELLSTSMEEFVFDNVNDYYFYLSSYFDNPAREFYRNPGGGNVYGYDLAIWNFFLKDKYGFDVIKKGLENVVNTSALEAMANAISEFDGSFKEDLSQFGIWNYFTGSRAKEGKYYEEAENYPLIKPLVSLDFTSNYKSVMVNSNPSSNNYIRFVDKSRGLPDTLVSIITNSDYFGNARHEFEYTVYNYEEEGTSMINDFYYSLLTAQNKLFFTESAIFNNELAVEGKTERREIDYSFPQPFSYNKHSTLFIPTGRDVSGKASLNVYTTSMDLVFSGEKDIFATDKIVVRWDGKKNNGEKLPTGVYIYVTKAGDNVKKGKIVIYNE